MSPETHMPANARPASRMKRKTFYIGATSASMIAYVGLMLASHTQPWLIWPGLAAAILSMIFACFWVATLDEAAQQAHYIAWFWGGNAGLLISVLGLIAVALQPAAFDPVLSALGAPRSFAAGIAFGVLPPVIGYAIWWAVLWMRRG